MKAIATFLGIAFAIYIGWYIFHDFYLLPKTDFVEELIILETKQSVYLLQKMPFNDAFEAHKATIMCNGKRALRIGEECNGLVLFVLFSGFILAYPGNWKNKIWFIPIGIILIYILNILRIVVLTINFKYFHSSFSFNHHVTFTYLVYACIFLMWMFWVNKLSKRQKSVD